MKEFDMKDLVCISRMQPKRATVAKLREGILVEYMNEDGEATIILYKNDKCDRAEGAFKINVVESSIDVNILVTSKYEDVIDYLSEAIMVDTKNKPTYDHDGFMRLVSKGDSGVRGFSSRGRNKPAIRNRKDTWPLSRYQTNFDCDLDCYGIEDDDSEAQSFVCNFTVLINRVSISYFKKSWHGNSMFRSSGNAKAAVRMLDYIADIGMEERTAENVVGFIMRSVDAPNDDYDF